MDVYPFVVFLRERVVLIVVVTVFVLDVVDLFEPLLGLLCRVPSQRALHGQVGVSALGAVGDKLLEAIFLHLYFTHCWHGLTLPLVEVDCKENHQQRVFFWFNRAHLPFFLLSDL